ncbi:CpaD family pilus assembly lipoprotein [Jeongeupia wiesaeckerbachi]|uniref:CpaD family pilus assembly lipoprotein n=1 Tax=Jeongeupia wiesaeckerbachi TaxID=3051218 RepID=UPI003D803BC9
MPRLERFAALLASAVLTACVAPGGPGVSASANYPVYQPLDTRIALDPARPLASQLAGTDVSRTTATVTVPADFAGKTELRRALFDAGVIAQRWLPSADGAASVAFKRDVAHAPACLPAADAGQQQLDGKWYGSRVRSSQLGCSVNANLAAQLARPADLSDPAQLDAPNAVRAVGAVEAYQRGNVPAPDSGTSFEAGSGGKGPM